MASSVKLNYINKSNATTPLQIAVTLSNPSSGAALVWQLIQYCSSNSSHPFVFTTDNQISVRDCYGNNLPELNAEAGQQFVVRMGATGTELAENGTSSNPSSIEVLNNLTQGGVDVFLNKSGKHALAYYNLMPLQLVSFLPAPKIYIGVVENAQEGQLLQANAESSVFTEISLPGISSADIVLTGGGSGPEATAYIFTLTNVVAG